MMLQAMGLRGTQVFVDTTHRNEYKQKSTLQVGFHDREMAGLVPLHYAVSLHIGTSPQSSDYPSMQVIVWQRTA